MLHAAATLTKTPEMILITDDDPGIREVFQALLRIKGFQVLVAEDGPVALELYRLHRENIAAVVTDMRMPKMHGTQLIAELRKINPAVRIVGITGYVGKEEAKVPKDIVLLRKPVAGSELLATLGALGVRKPE